MEKAGAEVPPSAGVLKDEGLNNGDGEANEDPAVLKLNADALDAGNSDDVPRPLLQEKAGADANGRGAAAAPKAPVLLAPNRLGVDAAGATPKGAEVETPNGEGEDKPNGDDDAPNPGELNEAPNAGVLEAPNAELLWKAADDANRPPEGEKNEGVDAAAPNAPVVVPKVPNDDVGVVVPNVPKPPMAGVLAGELKEGVEDAAKSELLLAPKPPKEVLPNPKEPGVLKAAVDAGDVKPGKAPGPGPLLTPCP